MELKEILDFKFIEFGDYSLSISKLIIVAAIFATVKIMAWIIKVLLARKWQSKKLDPGGQYAIQQIARYILWVIAITLTLETFGVKVTILLAGSTALLVGVGLGVQQTFNDIVSGIILLIEGSTKIGDVLEVEDEVVMVRRIGIRTSKVINRDDIIIIIPNSQIVTNKVINWTHQVKDTRFDITVGVAYGSDIELALKQLVASAAEHPLVSKTNAPQGRFIDFGESSLVLQVLFFSKETFRIELIKSDIRRSIDRKFRENGITIPFPQRDLHIKSGRLSTTAE